MGETAPAWLNAANEVAVAAFLDGRIRWIAIPDVLEAVLARHDGGPAASVDDVIDADRRAREAARTVIDERFTRVTDSPPTDTAEPAGLRRPRTPAARSRAAAGASAMLVLATVALGCVRRPRAGCSSSPPSP